jgi:hypothetical protein
MLLVVLFYRKYRTLRENLSICKGTIVLIVEMLGNVKYRTLRENQSVISNEFVLFVGCSGLS